MYLAAGLAGRSGLNLGLLARKHPMLSLTALKRLFTPQPKVSPNPRHAKRTTQTRLTVDCLEERLALSLTPITGTSSPPWTGLVSYEAHFADDPNGIYKASGVMIDSTHVLTCAHALYQAQLSNPWPDYVTVYLGRNGGNSSFDGTVAQATQIDVWGANDYQSHLGEGDLAIITLDPTTVPRNPYIFFPAFNNPNTSFQGTTMASAGYPDDGGYQGQNVPYFTQGTIDGTTTADDGEHLLYWHNANYNDPSGLSLYVHGQSGSPLYTIDASGNVNLEGVFLGTVPNTNDHIGFAYEITTDVQNWIVSVLNGQTSPSGPGSGRGFVGGGHGGGPNNPLPTTTTVIFAASPIMAGTPETFTAWVRAAGQTPTGTVTFTDGTTVLGTVPLQQTANGVGQATLTTTALTVGTHTVIASYGGATGFTTSSGSVSLQVNPVPITTTTTETASATTLLALQPLTLTATVSAAGAVPGGSVTFVDGTTVLGVAPLQLIGGVEQASITTTALTVGTHFVIAQYGGQGALGSSFGSVFLQVNPDPIPTTTTLMSSSPHAAVGQAVTLTATVIPNLPNAEPAGTVAFYDGRTLLGSASVQGVIGSGTASLTTSSLGSGSHTINAYYEGYSALGALIFSGSFSPAVTQTVGAQAPTLTVTDAGGTATGRPFAASGSAVGTDGTTPVAGSWTYAYYAGSSASGTPLAGAPSAAGTYTVVGTFTSSDPNYSGGSAQTTFTITPAQPESTPNERFIAAVYQDVLGRAAGAGEAAAWARAMDQGLPAAAVARALTHSAEYYQNLVTAAYHRYLGRAPDAAGLAGWVADLQQSFISDEQLEAYFIGSPEYIADHGGPGAGWVTGMYQDLLGRTPAPSEVEGWVGNLQNGMPPRQVAYYFAAGAEREGQRVTADYETYLHRAPTQAEVAGWVGDFLNGYRNEDVVAGFVGSQEYYLAHAGN
jgi:hypothetical protein